MLWKVLEKYGIPPQLVNVIKKMYRNIEIRIQEDGEVYTMQSTSGVKQGDNLAPLLFLFMIQAAADLTEAHWSFEKPMLWKDKKEYLNSRRRTKDAVEILFNRSFYADDAAFIFLSRADAIAGCKVIVEQFARLGLTVHLGRGASKSKTEAMYIPVKREGKNAEEQAVLDDLIKSQTADIYIDDERFIRFTNKFKYLGTVIDFRLSEEANVKELLRRARYKVFHQMRSILTNRAFPLKLRAQLYLQGPLSIALFGCASWTLTSVELRCLLRFHHDCVRLITGTTWKDHKDSHVKVSDLLEKMDIPEIDEIYRRRSLKFVDRKVNGAKNSIVRDVLFAHAPPKAGHKMTGRQYKGTRSTYMDSLMHQQVIETRKEAKYEVFGASLQATLHRDSNRGVRPSRPQ